MSTPDQQEYAFARCDRLEAHAELLGAQAHADRAPGARFKVRPGTNPNDDQIRWTRGDGDGVFDLVEGWRMAKGWGRERKSAPICLHLLLGVSPSWVTRSGGLHDRDNPSNIALFEAARDFCAREIGNVAAARLDLDEQGGGVVDVFVVPVFGRQRRLRKDGTRSSDSIPEISCNKAFDRLREATGELGDYSALQTAWATYAQKHLDPTLERGQRKWMTGRRHLETPEYREQMIETEALEERAASARAEIQKLQAEHEALEEARRSLEWREAGVARLEREYRNEIDREVKAIAQAWARLAREQELSADDRAAMGASMAIEASTVLGTSIEAIKAEKAAQEKHAEELLREEQRVAQLRFNADDRQRELDERESKIADNEEAIRTRDAESRDRATKLDQWKNRLRVAEEAVSAAQELATFREDEAKRLMSLIEEALRAILRRWSGKPEAEDEKLLGDPDIAPLTQAAEAVSIEIKRQRELISDRFAGAELANTANRSWEARLDDRENQLDTRDAEARHLEAEIAERETKLADQERDHQKTVANHNVQVARDLEKLACLAPALEREFGGRPAQGDQQILDDPLFTQIVAPMRQARQRHDADLTSKQAAMTDLDRDMTALGQTSRRIKAVGPALSDWLAGKLTEDQKAVLQHPEARPFVDAFSGVWRAISERRKAVEAQEKEFLAKAEERQKAEADAAARLVAMEKSASDLADLIEANEAKAKEIENALGAYAKVLDTIAARQKQPSPVPQIEMVVSEAKTLVQTTQRLRSTRGKGGMERD